MKIIYTPEILIVSLLCGFVLSQTTNICPELGPYCECSLNDIRCEEFTSYRDLDFTKLDADSPVRRSWHLITLRPARMITLNNELSLAGLDFKDYTTIHLHRLDGIDLGSNPFLGLEYHGEHRVIIDLKISDSVIRTVGIDCDVNALAVNSVGLFATFRELTFGDGNVYTGELCPVVFRKANLQYVFLDYMSNTNFLRFSSINNVDLEVFINRLYIWFPTDIVLTNSILDKHVFENLNELIIFIMNDYYSYRNGTLAAIEDDALIHTQKLSLIEFVGQNFGSFIGRSNNKWMSTLNADVLVDYSSAQSLEANRHRSLVIHAQDYGTYDYPDADIDKFQHFPHQRMVFFKPMASVSQECTKTLEFLLQNAQYYEPPFYLYASSGKCLDNFVKPTPPTDNSVMPTPNTFVEFAFLALTSLVFFYI